MTVSSKEIEWAVSSINAVLADRAKMSGPIAEIQRRRYVDSANWRPQHGLDGIELIKAAGYSMTFGSGLPSNYIDLAELPENHSVARTALMQRFVPKRLHNGVTQYFKEVRSDV